MPEQYPFLPFYGDDFFNSERVLAMTPFGVALYVRMLWIQWQKGSVPDDVETVALLGRMRASDAKKGWQEARSCFDVDKEGRLVNARIAELISDRERRAEKNRANGRAGGRPRKTAIIDDGHPESNPSRTQEEPTRLSVGSHSETRAITETKGIKQPHGDTTDSDESGFAAGPHAESGPPARARSEPFDSVSDALTSIAERLEVPGPTREEILGHCGKASPLRLLIGKLGWPKVAELYVWTARHRPNGMGWPEIWRNHTALLSQMRNGVERVPVAKNAQTPSGAAQAAAAALGVTTDV